MEALRDAIRGASGLGFNSRGGPLVEAIINATNSKAARNYGPGRLEEGQIVTVNFFTEKMDYSTEKLRKIRCPVKLIHCSEDIAYPLHHTEELLQRLVDAGVDVELEAVSDAPHFGTVTNAMEINSLLHDFLMKQTTSNVPLPSEEVTSPYEAMLVAEGWSPDHENESSDEDDLVFDTRSLVS
ncbi:hypothetical protein C0989_011414 [Termitomyces sp. Mn162]|nr:hypothetical protein C0989_011414 [Termitomyces sp. Mn162]